jgi:hypothetical protein
MSLFFVNAPSSAYSNDPNGELFLSRTFLDFSNCGPIAALMLDKFSQPTFIKEKPSSLNDSILAARKIVQKNEKRSDEDNVSYRWWRTSDIKRYLESKKIDYSAIDTSSSSSKERHEKIINELKQGSAVVVNVDMNDLPLGFGSGVGKPYFTFPIFGRWGHFLVIVGYEEINGRTAYEIHDSYSKKGKNRLYYADNINKAIQQYNKELLFVRKNKAIDSRFLLNAKEALAAL